MKKHVTLLATLLVSATFSACSIHGGSKEYVNPPTLGKELTDLKKALASGAINEDEYGAMKEELSSNASNHYQK